MDDDSFVEASEVTVLIPQATEVEIRDLVTTQNQKQAPLHTIVSRSLLYFDELLSVYIALKCPISIKDDLRAFTERLSISLDIIASGSAPRRSREAPNEATPIQEDLIWRGTLVAAEDPVIVPLQHASDETDGSSIAVWEVKALLSRPRFRLQSPMMLFKASAVLLPLKNKVDEDRRDPYLPSGIPASPNLFEPLQTIGSSKGHAPSLSASRLHRVQQLDEGVSLQPKPVLVRNPEPFPALPAISSRIRYHKANSQPGRAVLVASLDMEMAPFSKDDIEISSVDMQLVNGTASDLGQGQVPKLPLRCKPRDSVVFLYQLTLDDLLKDTSNNPAKTVDITVNGAVLISDQSKPLIQMHWRTGVDFASALNPAFGAPAQSMQRSKRPTSLTVPTVTGSTSASHHVSDPGQSAAELGITITFAAPAKVYVREPFAWDILILNNSSKSRRLSLSVVSNKTKTPSKMHLQHDTASAAPEIRENKIADPFVDESVLYASHKMAMANAPNVLSLSPTVETRRVGTLMHVNMADHIIAYLIPGLATARR